MFDEKQGCKYIAFLNYYIFFLQGEKIQTILKAANVNVDSYWPGLFAKALEGINVKELITNIGSGVGAAPAGAGTYFFFFSIASYSQQCCINLNYLSFITYLQSVAKLSKYLDIF